MKNNYLQEDREIINKINRSFLANIIIMGFYLFAFKIMKGKFLFEQKLFMHLTEDQGFISKLLSIFSSIVFCVIFLSTAVYLIKRYFLRKYRHIRSNLFFLNNRWIITLNCLLRICSYIMLVMSFMSLQRLLLTIIFISLFSLLEKRRDFESQLSPGFFSWEDIKLCRLFAYSLVLAISFPLYNAIAVTQWAQKLGNNTSKRVLEIKEGFPPEARKFIDDTFPKIPFGPLLLSGQELLGKILSSKETKGGVFVIILLGFVKNSIEQSISSFRNFWKEVTTTVKRVEWFKLFANFQLAVRDKKTRGAGQGINGFPSLCYESFTLYPNFIKEGYIENTASFDKKFVGEIENINKLIKLVSNEINDTEEKIFILYWVFNHIKSFQDFSSYSESIKQLNNVYSRDTVI